MRIHTVDDPAAFAAGDSELAAFTETQAEEGLTEPNWWFVAEDHTGRRGRLALRRQYTCDDEWRGSLPEHELYVFGVEAPWDDSPEKVLRPLVEAAAEAVKPAEVAWRIGTYHDHAVQKAATAAAIGLPLFHEKTGYIWRDRGEELPDSGRLEFASVNDVGRPGYADVLSQVVEAGPDREAAWYVSQMPSGGWGQVMMEALEEEDAADWLVASVGGEVVGQVAITSFDPEYGDGTIVWIGVVPEHRGRGYGVDLIRQAQRSARRRGFTSMLSDTDVLNVGMQETFARSGHEQTEWHVWHHRWRA